MSAIVLFRGYVVGEGPEIKYSAVGEPWVRFVVATKPMKKVAEGGYEKPKNPVFLEVRAFKDIAEYLADNLTVRCYVEGVGAYAQRRWTSDTGDKCQRDYVVMDRLPLIRKPHSQGGRSEPVLVDSEPFSGSNEEDSWGSIAEPPLGEGY